MPEDVDLSEFMTKPQQAQDVDLSEFMQSTKKNFPGKMTPTGFQESIPIEDYTKDTPESFGKRIASHADPKAWQPSQYGFKTLQATIGDTPKTIREDGAMWDPDLKVWSYQDPRGGAAKRAPDTLAQPEQPKTSWMDTLKKKELSTFKTFADVSPVTKWMYGKIAPTVEADDPGSALKTVVDKKVKANAPWTLLGMDEAQYQALPLWDRAKADAKAQGIQLKNTAQTAQMMVPHMARQIVKTGAGLTAMAQDAGTQLGDKIMGADVPQTHADVVAENKQTLALLGLPESIADLPQYASEKIANLWQDPKKVDELLSPGPDTIGGETGQAIRLAGEMLIPTKALETAGVAPQLAENLMSGGLGTMGGGTAYDQTAVEKNLPITQSRNYAGAQAAIQGLIPKVGLSKMGEGYSGMVANNLTQNPVARDILAKTGAAGLDAGAFTVAQNAAEKYTLNPDKSLLDLSALPETMGNFLLLKAGSPGVKYTPKEARDVMANVDLTQPLMRVAERASQGDQLAAGSKESNAALEREMMGTKSATFGDQAQANMIVKHGVPGATQADHSLVSQTRAEMAANTHAEANGLPIPFPEAQAKVEAFTPTQKRANDIATNLNRTLRDGLAKLAALKGDAPPEDNPWMDSRVVLDHPDTLGGLIKRGGSRTTAGAEKARTVNAFVDQNGQRAIGTEQDNGSIVITRPDGSHGELHKDGGQLLDREGNAYTQTHATPAEAESVTGLNYSKNAVANNAKSIVDVNNAIRNVHVQQAIKQQAGDIAKQHIEAGNTDLVSTLDDNAKGRFPQIGDTPLPTEWVRLLNDKAATDTSTGFDKALAGTKAGFLKAMFQASPFYHSVKNVTLHNIQSAGVDLPAYLDNLSRASEMVADLHNGVVTPEMKAYLDAGTPTLADYSKNNDFRATFEKESGKADLKLPETGPADTGFKQTDLSNRVTWTPDDVGRLALTITKAEKMTGKPWLEITPSERASAAYEIARHNPDYQVSSFDPNAWVANSKFTKSIGLFQKYGSQMTKGMRNSFADLLPGKGAATPELTSSRRKDSAAGLFTASLAAGVMAGIGGAAVRGLTGDEDAAFHPGAGVGATYRLGKAVYDEGMGASALALNEFIKTGPVMNILVTMQNKIAAKFGQKGANNLQDWVTARDEAKKGNFAPMAKVLPHETEALMRTLITQGAFSLGPLIKEDNPNHPVSPILKVLRMFGMAQKDLPEDLKLRLSKAPKQIEPKSILKGQPADAQESTDLSEFMVKQ